jgi:hypothetical protein
VLGVSVLVALVTASGSAEAQHYRRYSDPFFFFGPRARFFVPSSRFYQPRGLSYAAPDPFQPIESYRERRSSRFGARDPLRRKTTEQLRKAAPVEAPKGQLLIAISIAKQELTLFDDGVAIARSPISTGTPSHPTPTGVFSVIQKARFHRSNLYSAAPMPFMQRITWSGVALHGGVLPGYPASHGCIRLPSDFAVRLWSTTKLGARVIISHGTMMPTDIEHTKLLALKAPKAMPSPTDAESMSRSASELRLAGLTSDDRAGANGVGPIRLVSVETGSDPVVTASADISNPAPAAPAAKGRAAPTPPISVLVSRKERRIYVRQGFDPLFDLPVAIKDSESAMGTHVFTAMAAGDGGTSLRWNVVSMPASERELGALAKRDTRKANKKRKKKSSPVEESDIASVPQSTPVISAQQALDRIELPPQAIARISALVVPGSSLIISDEGLGPETGVGTGFVVLTR